MTEMIDLMKQHSSVRSFTNEKISDEDLRSILDAGRSASSWKNFQSYSIIVVRNQEKKEALFRLVPQEAIRQSSVFLLFVGDLNRAEKGVKEHTDNFYPQGIENLLISSVDTSLVAQNTLLAAESLGYGGVMIGVLRDVSKEVAKLFELPDYTYPVMGMALGKPATKPSVKPRLPYETVVFEENYQIQDSSVIQTYDQVQLNYAAGRAQESWSQRLANQFGLEPSLASQENLKEKKLLD